MKAKDFKEIISSMPDDYEIGTTKMEDHRTHNLHGPCWVNVFHKLDTFKVDVENKHIILE